MLWNKNSSFFLSNLKKINNFNKNMQFERKLTYMEFDESHKIINAEFLYISSILFRVYFIQIWLIEVASFRILTR